MPELFKQDDGGFLSKKVLTFIPEDFAGSEEDQVSILQFEERRSTGSNIRSHWISEQYDGDILFEAQGITHWMSLPDSPKEQQGASPNA